MDVMYYIGIIGTVSGAIYGVIKNLEGIMNFFGKIFKKDKIEKKPELFIPTCPCCFNKMKFVSQEYYNPDLNRFIVAQMLSDNLKRKRTYTCKKCDIYEPVIYTCKTI